MWYGTLMQPLRWLGGVVINAIVCRILRLGSILFVFFYSFPSEPYIGVRVRAALPA